MTTPAWTAPSDQPGRRPTWLVLTASERGASHITMQAPNQDSFGYERAGAQGMVAAVADGHGHSRHLRSGRGSRLATQIGCQVAQELADQIEGGLLPDISADAIAALTEEFLVPEVVGRWREGVRADVEADPFTATEEGFRVQGDDPTIAYGSTLLLGMTLGDWLILAQIGDGDVVGVGADGRAVLPVPTDPQLDGLVTTSLCGPDARSDFRVAVVDTRQTPLVAVLLATDGYANAQVVEDWPGAFSADLAGLLANHDVNWLASQLPGWAAHCASAHGSADDTTIALLVASMAAMPRPPEDGEHDKDEITVPAAPHAQTTPSGTVPSAAQPTEPQPAAPHPTEPITVRLTAVAADGHAVAGDADSGRPTADGQAGYGEAGAGEEADAGEPDRHAEPVLAEQATAEWEPPDGGAGAP